MKHKKIYISSLILIIAAAAVISFTQVSQAAGTNLGINKKAIFANHVKNINKTKPASAQIAVMKAKQQAIIAALDANNYNAWLTAVGTSSPLLTKINATNFPQYDQAYQLRKQADAIITNLGIQKGERNDMMNSWDK